MEIAERGRDARLRPRHARRGAVRRAESFAAAPDFRGTLFGLFQPGEECNPGGASLVLAEKPFEGYGVRAVVGEHVEPQLEVGTLGFRAGKYMAASDELRFRVRGTGGHGAMRKQLKDPVAAGAELLTRLIALNGEECVLSIGRVEAGGATNIVPDEIYMEGTLRTFDERERGIIHRRIEIIAADIDARHGVKTEVTIGRGYPCVVNDEILVKQATALAKAEKLKVAMLPLSTTAEDFGFYCQQYPSLFYRLGVGAAAGRPHTATFFPDEAAIGVGIAFMRKLAPATPGKITPGSENAQKANTTEIRRRTPCKFLRDEKTKQRSENGARKTDRTSIILSMFREFPNNKFSLKHLASASGGATKEGRRETLEILGRLFEEGVVEECAREKYRLMQTHLPHYEGVADMAPSGSVYVKVEGQESDIFVNQRNAANALNGDRVEVVVMHRGRNGQLEGEITRIIERNRKPYVGVAEVGAHQIFVRADSRRMPMDIYLSKRTYPDVRDGEKVVVRIADWLPGSKSPVGELVERLGMAGNNDTEMHSILAEYELPYRFEPEIERGRPGHRRPRHGQRDRPAARLPGCHDLHGRSRGRQGLRRRAVGAQNKGRRLGSGRAHRRRDPLRAAPLGDRRRGRGARHVGLSGGPHRADAS